MSTETDLIIGVIKGYDWSKVSLWAESVATCGYTGSVAVIQYTDLDNKERDETVAQNLNALGIQVVKMPLLGPIFHQRFYDISRILRQTPNFRFVVATDVRDVVFQYDPMPFLESCLDTHEKAIYAATEGLLYKHEGWGSSNLQQSFGADGAHVQDLPIYNAGVISGRTKAIADLFYNIYALSNVAKYPQGGGGPDQAAYNLILSSDIVEPAVYYGDHDEGYAAQLGTTVDPNKIASFRPNLLCPEPGFDEVHGEVVNSAGVPYAIVHQYDRTPHWEPAIRARVARRMGVALTAEEGPTCGLDGCP